MTARIGAMLLLRHHLDLWREHGKQGASGATGVAHGNARGHANGHANGGDNGVDAEGEGGANIVTRNGNSSNVVVPNLSLIELVREVR